MDRLLVTLPWLLVSVLAFASAPVGMTHLPDQQATSDDAKLLREFEERVERYMSVHRRMLKQSSPLVTTDDPAKIHASQTVLAEKIRSERVSALRGEVFTPDISELFRRRLQDAMKETSLDTKRTIAEETPVGVSLRINGKYPQSVPLPTMPPSLLAVLPPLPKELEYRIVGRDMILLDGHARLIVDYIPKAIP